MSTQKGLAVPNLNRVLVTLKCVKTKTKHNQESGEKWKVCNPWKLMSSTIII
jgi:hypothetical protein